MRELVKSVFYCDFCKKRTLSKSSIRLHEKHCTANINRECRLCDGGAYIKEIIESLKERFAIIIATENKPFEFEYEEVKWIGEEITLDEVRRLTDDCPVCILAIMRQCKFTWSCFVKYGFDKFDYKKESEEYKKQKHLENFHDSY